MIVTLECVPIIWHWFVCFNIIYIFYLTFFLSFSFCCWVVNLQIKSVIIFDLQKFHYLKQIYYIPCYKIYQSINKNLNHYFIKGTCTCKKYWKHGHTRNSEESYIIDYLTMKIYIVLLNFKDAKVEAKNNI